MVMMMVFGLLSLSSAKADLRLSQKAVTAQKVYYELDGKGERLNAACAAAAASAQKKAGVFMSEKLYSDTLPDDFFSCLTPLIGRVQSGDNSAYETLSRGVFFYYLQQQLESIRGDYNLSYKVDTGALQDAIVSGNADARVACVYSVIHSTQAENNSLNITLVCAYGTALSSPSFRAEAWETNVSGLEISGSSHINVWAGE